MGGACHLAFWEARHAHRLRELLGSRRRVWRLRGWRLARHATSWRDARCRRADGHRRARRFRPSAPAAPHGQASAAGDSRRQAAAGCISLTRCFPQETAVRIDPRADHEYGSAPGVRADGCSTGVVGGDLRRVPTGPVGTNGLQGSRGTNFPGVNQRASERCRARLPQPEPVSSPGRRPEEEGCRSGGVCRFTPLCTHTGRSLHRHSRRIRRHARRELR